MSNALLAASETDAAQVVTLREAKAHLRITLDAEDDRTMVELDAAISWAADYMRRPVRRTQYTLSMPTWDRLRNNRAGVHLRGYVASVDSIEYTDSAGTLQTIASSVYEVKTGTHHAEVRELPNQSWPGLNEYMEAVKVTYTAGYTQADVPFPIKQAILLKLEHIHDDSAAALSSAESLCMAWILPPW